MNISHTVHHVCFVLKRSQKKENWRKAHTQRLHCIRWDISTLWPTAQQILLKSVSQKAFWPAGGHLIDTHSDVQTQPDNYFHHVTLMRGWVKLFVCGTALSWWRHVQMKSAHENNCFWDPESQTVALCLNGTTDTGKPKQRLIQTFSKL